jgi:hypothetical protein
MVVTIYMFHQMNKSKTSEMENLGKEKLDKKESDAQSHDKSTIAA